MKVKGREIIAYGAGDGAFAFVGTLIGFYQLYFFTDVFGLAPATVAVIMLVIKIWDTVNHPLMGILADRTRSKHGRYRPWILYSIIPLAVASILTFYAPSGLTELQKVVYATTVCFIYWTAFAAINVSYVALMSVMTSDLKVRAKLSSARFIGAFGASTLAMFFTKDLVAWFGNGNEAAGFLYVGIFYTLIGSIILYWTFSSTKERIAVPETSVLTPWGDIKSLFRMGPFWVVIIASVFVGIFVHIKSNLAVYYLKYVVQEPSVDKYFMAGGTISCLVGVCVVAFFIGRFDKRKLFIFLMSVNAIFISAIYWVDPANIALLLMCHFLNSFFGGACAPVFFAIYADFIDYFEFKTGARSAALINSLGLFAGNFGAAIGGFIAPMGLAWIGYAANTQQTEESINGLTWLFAIAPAIFAAGTALTMILYPLTKSVMNSICTHLDQKRLAII
jgi:glycoside/pentoside/hexuronide:cation symporter, GPH family